MIHSRRALESRSKLLAAREGRRFLPQVLDLLLWAELGSDNLNIRALTAYIPLLRSIRTLVLSVQVWPRRAEMARAALLHELQSNTFPELRRCSLALHSADYSSLVGILNAPKLVSLAVVGTDLRGVRSELIRQQSTTLKELSLSGICPDIQSSATLISLPVVLTHLEFDLDSHWVLAQSNNPMESSIQTQIKHYPQKLELLLSTVERCQPQLTTLALSVCQPDVLASESFGCDLDFSRLHFLKKLHFRSDDIYERVKWVPHLAFRYLPPFLETLKFSYGVGRCIDLYELADVLADLQRTGGGHLPPSLSRIEFCNQVDRPVSGTEDYRRGSGIVEESVHHFMTLVPIRNLSYTFHNTFDEKKWSQIVEARRLSETGISRMTLGHRTHELNDYLVFSRFVDSSRPRIYY